MLGLGWVYIVIYYTLCSRDYKVIKRVKINCTGLEQMATSPSRIMKQFLQEIFI